MTLLQDISRTFQVPGMPLPRPPPHDHTPANTELPHLGQAHPALRCSQEDPAFRYRSVLCCADSPRGLPTSPKY